MSAKIIRDNNAMPELMAIIEELNQTEIQIGIFGKDDSHILMIANVNEFGATIKPKRAKRLAIPLSKKARGKSPREFNDLFPLRTADGMLYLVRNKGANKLEFLYWLATEVTIPERAFIRGTFDEYQNLFANRAATLLKRVIRRQLDLDSFFNFMGQFMVDRIKEYMTNLRSPANSFATTSAKGSSNPLVDSGRLRASITYRVVKR